jgi:predicted metal-binding membrane protein
MRAEVKRAMTLCDRPITTKAPISDMAFSVMTLPLPTQKKLEAIGMRTAVLTTWIVTGIGIVTPEQVPMLLVMRVAELHERKSGTLLLKSGKAINFL